VSDGGNFEPFPPGPQGLYDPANEHDACGVGFIAHIKGKKSHELVQQGLLILKNLTHRGAVGWDPKLSDGSGLLIQVPDRFFRRRPAGRPCRPSASTASGWYSLPGAILAPACGTDQTPSGRGPGAAGWQDVPVGSSNLMSPRSSTNDPAVFVGRSPK
jgi:glutamate synthase domain-containing protein 1